jgi:hypothetical protein
MFVRSRIEFLKKSYENVANLFVGYGAAAAVII